MKDLTLKATAIGSLPHKDTDEAISLIFDKFKKIPFWPQLAKISKKQEMTTQYIQGIPGIKFDDRQEKYIYESQSDEFFEQLEEFFMDYEAIINENDFSNLEKYAITQPYTTAIIPFLRKLKQHNYKYAKGHIIGPFTWGTSLCDYENVCAFYDETYREVLIKGLTLKAIWQIQQIKKNSPDTKPIIFLDEPVMSQYGTSAFITVQKNDIVESLSEISDIIKKFGGISAIHCCGKSDWSLLMETGINIINFDAYSYSKSLGAYAKELNEFLNNGGYIAWGIVPTLDKEALQKTNLQELVIKFEEGLEDLISKGIDKDLLINQSFFTPSCGAGSLTIKLAEKAMTLVNELSEFLVKKYKNEVN